MLRTLSLKNFRSWEDTGLISLAPLTGLFGSNSSGKSSLVRFLLMLKQTAESRDRGIQLVLGGKDAYVDLGAMRDVLFGHHADRELGWSLCWDEPSWPIESPSDEFRTATESSPICLSVRHALRAKTTVCESMTYSVDGYSFGLERQQADGKPKYGRPTWAFKRGRAPTSAIRLCRISSVPESNVVLVGDPNDHAPVVVVLRHRWGRGERDGGAIVLQVHQHDSETVVADSLVA